MNQDLWEIMSRDNISEVTLPNGWRLERTSFACPEQYDLFDGEEIIAYLRLRHGCFTVTCPDVGGDVVYSASPDGDGIFDDDERASYLFEALLAVASYVKRQGDKDGSSD